MVHVDCCIENMHSAATSRIEKQASGNKDIRNRRSSRFSPASVHEDCTKMHHARPGSETKSAGNGDCKPGSVSRCPPALYFVLCILILNQLPTTVAAKCEPISEEITTCQGMPWNLTHMPNLVHHSSQKNAALVLSQFEVLLNAGCSRYLRFFLCSMFTPMCFHNEGALPKIVPPCRKICRDARDNCEPLMLKHHVTWPRQLSCEVLPEYHRGMCIIPDAFIARPAPDEHQPTAEPECNIAKPKKCPKCKRFKMKTKIFREKRYDFVIRIQVEKTIKTACDAKAKVNVTGVLKMRAVEIRLGPNELVFNGSCICPSIKRNRGEYVVAGYEDVSTGTLYLDRGSMAEKWGTRWAKRLNKWVKVKPRVNRRSEPHRHGSTSPPRKSRGGGGGRKKGRKGKGKKGGSRKSAAKADAEE